MNIFLYIMTIMLSCYGVKVFAASDAGVKCSMNITPVAFGAYNPLVGSAVNVTNGIYVTCNATTANSSVAYTVDFSGGNSGNTSPRQLLAGANVLNYRSYSDSGRTMEFITGTACSVSYNLPIANKNQSQFCYAYYTILSGQTTAYPGSYSDMLAITLNY